MMPASNNVIYLALYKGRRVVQPKHSRCTFERLGDTRVYPKYLQSL